MSVTLTITGDTSAELLKDLQGLVVAINGKLTTETPTGSPKKQTKEKVATPAPVIEEALATNSEETSSEETEGDSEVVTIEQLVTAVRGKVQAGKTEEVRKVLTELGVKKVTELKMPQYAYALDQLKAIA